MAEIIFLHPGTPDELPSDCEVRDPALASDGKFDLRQTTPPAPVNVQELGDAVDSAIFAYWRRLGADQAVSELLAWIETIENWRDEP